MDDVPKKPPEAPWTELFLNGPTVSADFLAPREQPPAEIRESLLNLNRMVSPVAGSLR